MKIQQLILALALSLVMPFLTGCYEEVHNLTEKSEEGTIRVVLNVSPFEQKDFGTRAANLNDVVTRLDLGVYDRDGNRVNKINQKSTDEDFGSPVFYLLPGNYTLVCIAHNGLGVATIGTTPEQVTFSNNKVTDTFYYGGDLVVGDEDQTTSVTLSRPVAMVRFVFTDTEFPADFSQMEFYYTGGSSTFNPMSGYGTVNSKQTELRVLADCPLDAEGNHIFEIYTFPHTTNDVLKIKLTPKTESGEDLTPFIREFNDVAVTINKISEYKGVFFSSGSSASTTSFSFNVQNQWGGTSVTTF